MGVRVGAEPSIREVDVGATMGAPPVIIMPATINKLYPDPKRYPQVFEDRFGFVPNLSVLDYLFCVGPKK